MRHDKILSNMLLLSCLILFLFYSVADLRMNMKKYLIILVLTLVATTGKAQLVINSQFKPLSYEQLMLHAQAEAYREQEAKERFDQYQERAYGCYRRGDYKGFIYYSDYALKTGWYNSELYYDRGVAFEHLHEYGKAKKEYKRAIKKGFYPAVSAYEQCKIHQKAWKKEKK